MLGDLKNKTALVTGGASGIGRGICLALAEQGAKVAVADRNVEGTEQVAADVAKTGVATLAIRVDVTNQASVDEMVAKVVDAWGQVDILVNDAGVIGGPQWWDRDENTQEDWTYTFDVNVRGLVMATDAAAVHMKKRKSGKVINIASIAALRGGPDYPHYNASKAAVVSYTKSVAIQLGPHSINVNAICPGLLWTPMWERISQRQSRSGVNAALHGLSQRELFDKVVADTTPLKREQTPRDIGKMAAFLASDDAMNITGQAFVVDGGFTAGG
ncbi:MAG: SDR family oxidoreductase [Chloroflexi bacterium]|nr:SDR family oxidoreductase [Chloroflexota bacterium]